MKKFKLFLKPLTYVFLSTIILSIIGTVFYYFNIISSNTMSIIKIIIIIISILLGSFIYGKNIKEKGLLEGIKLGFLIILILFLISYLGLNKSFKLKNIIYYLIIIGTSSIGSMIGLNKKKDSN